MRFQMLASALALVGTSTAFSDSSPWILLSTSPFENVPNAKQVELASRVFEETKDLLKSCPTDTYLLVNQRGVTTASLRRTASDACAMPSLCRATDDQQVQGKFVVPEVVGKIKDMDGVRDTGLPEFLAQACASMSKDVKIDLLDLASPPSDDYASALTENDAMLAERLTAATADDSFTILFMSTPGELSYESRFDEPVRMDLKRHVQGSHIRRKDNETEWDKLPLFEKYQFFTPGIFMGIITAIVLISILGVGIRALASLEVSYGAFEKEMGPAAQKKQ